MRLIKEGLEDFLFTYSKQYKQLRKKYLRDISQSKDIKNYLFDLIDDGFNFEWHSMIRTKEGKLLSDDWESNKEDYYSYYRLKVYRTLDGIATKSHSIYRYDEYKKWIDRLDGWNKDIEIATDRICDDFNLEITERYIQGHPNQLKESKENFIDYIFGFYGNVIKESDIDKLYQEYKQHHASVNWATQGLMKTAEVFKSKGMKNAIQHLDIHPGWDDPGYKDDIDIGFIGLEDEIITVSYVNRKTGKFTPDNKEIDRAIETWNEENQEIS